ncbi:MAG: hypothetical protein DWQ07_07930 [Chloroflexi bacterium]|nr:MAG: hypothetical protein DWQ07_07930 [Chloroflexota bacterium]MBL1197033.1 hypothetical protein [Chloroflexota bacterium]NOH14328.1 hypothetical protein [Chloroflexota bacterium]
MITIIFWTLLAFVLGSIPFSALLTKIFLSRDIRAVGDGNPGATNAWKAGGWLIGVAAMLLDALKGAVPILLAQLLTGLRGWDLLPMSLASILGHAYSPWLKCRGGKALATTFGVWTGLSLGEIPIILGIFLGLFLWVQDNDGWAVVFGFLGTLAHLLLNHPDLFLLSLLVVNSALVIWKYRQVLMQRPQLRVFVKQGERMENKHA